MGIIKKVHGVIKMKKYILLIAALLVALNPQAYATGVTKTGTTAAGFLLIDVGPRATGMGSAYVSVVDDATAMYWNPAGIARLPGVQATFCNTNWLLDLALNYAGASFSLGNYGTIGINAVFLSMDEMERTTISQPDGTGELFDAANSSIGLSYARNLTDKFCMGFTAKYINERYYHSSAHGFALDLGALYDTHFHGLTLGMSISNYGTKMQLDGRDLLVQVDINPQIEGNNANINAKLQTDKFDLPLMFRVGLSMDVIKTDFSHLLVAVDALHPSDDVESVNVGAELILFNILSLRSGMKQLFGVDQIQGLTFGGGLHHKILNTTLFFDYSYLTLNKFHPVNMFSISLGL
jgi:hypothetical protein